MKIHVKRVLNFFDEIPPESSRHVTGIVAVSGEDLGAGLFKHYMEKKCKAQVRVLQKTPTTGKKKGRRLDRWITVDWPDKTKRLFQTEIKNWSAHAIGGQVLPIEASKAQIRTFAIHQWEKQWNYNKSYPKWKNVRKVLIRMKRPPEIPRSYRVAPLVIMWMVMHPHGSSECLFTQKIHSKSGFKKIWYFSMSSYLRIVSKKMISVDMPDMTKRMAWFKELFSNS